jgi:hypothetical protein
MDGTSGTKQLADLDAAVQQFKGPIDQAVTKVVIKRRRRMRAQGKRRRWRWEETVKTTSKQRV